MENNNSILSKSMKLLVAFVVFVYVISPVDCFPGHIDDIIVILMGIAVNRRQIGGGN